MKNDPASVEYISFDEIYSNKVVSSSLQYNIDANRKSSCTTAETCLVIISRHVPDPKLYARESEWYSRFITRAMTASYKLTVLLEEE